MNATWPVNLLGCLIAVSAVVWWVACFCIK